MMTSQPEKHSAQAFRKRIFMNLPIEANRHS